MTTIVLALVALAGLTAFVWAVDRRLVAVTARLRQAWFRPVPPYAGFDMAAVYRVSWEDCPRCRQRHAPHEADDEAGIVRCVGCGHRRPGAEGVGR
ncbi:hypothetical protein I5Q34_33545 [Streptomyces sp. AV19]|uniref:hypothetical protein n=1 Tax=Streptomyces sp. AV19 TaxID=2793068 RepID=UPI0018FF01EF|nr:hypothetical protein [Streptomyces sp. AV19]MBH1939127.1 hypothetical protein [Streptomyces sp. AV19]MDG4531664.1 hypothetical protein [Streptomyces sp. AV19]